MNISTAPIRIAALFAWVLLCGAVAAVRPESVAVRLDASAGRLRVVLPAGVSVEAPKEAEGREILIRFAQPAEVSRLEELPALSAGWVENASGGYDSLLLRTSRAVEIDVVSSETETVVLVMPAVRNEADSGTDDGKEQLRLQLLRARWKVETGRTGAASDDLRALSGSHPADPDVLASRANLDLQMGRWRRADGLYARVLSLSPGNEDVADARRRLHREQGPRATVEYTRKDVSDGWREDVLRASGQALLGGGLRAGIAADEDFVETGRIRRADGGLGRFDGVRRRAEMYLQQNFEDGTQLSGSFFLDRRNRGAGLGVSRGDTAGSTRVAAEYRRPYWEFVEGLVDGGFRDRLEAYREQRISRRLSGWVQGAVNRYGLDTRQSAGLDTHESDPAESNPGTRSRMASSAGISGGLTCVLSNRPNLALQYGFDGEYRRSIHSRLSLEGELYSPIPLVSREVHAFDIAMGGTLHRSLRMDGFAGFALDRLGGTGPYLGMRFVGSLSRSIDAEADFERRLSSVNTGSVVNRLTGRVVWKLGR
jgi:hypothetical protein